MRKALIFTAVLFAVPLFAQTSKAGQAGAKFLSLPYSVRGESMGGAFVSLVSDPSAVFYNPAGAALVDRSALYAMAGSWWGAYDYALSYSAPRKNGVLSIFLSGVYMGGIESYELTPSEEIVYKGEIAYLATQLGVGYATFLTDKFAVGMNAKLIYEGYGGYTTAYSFAIDAGTYYYTGFRDFVLGSSIRHFGFDAKLSGEYVRYEYTNELVETTVTYTAYKLPTTYSIGLSGTLYKNNISRLIGAVELFHPVDNLESYNFGLEYSILNMIFIRAGYKLYVKTREAVGDSNGFTLGLGLKYGKFTFDYGYYNKGIMPPINQIAFMMQF